MTDVKDTGDAVGKVMLRTTLYITHAARVVWQWVSDDLERCIHRGSQRPPPISQ